MCLKTIVFCLLVIVLVELVSYTQTLDDNGEGVCVVKLSSRQRRKKPYNVAINKWCGRRKCVVKRYKYETYLTWTNHTVCCNGWQHDSEQDICAPICSTGCNGGKCVSPDQCQCLSPAYLDPERPNTCITPVCNPTCFNAICHVNNTCICQENYTPYNSTHCFKCDEGYTADENLNCVPVCDQPCINSTCTAPNTCTCADGYRKKNNSTCEPICDCVNADCAGPHTCACHKGYVPLNKTVCVPKCNGCSHGECVAPNKCSCHKGYSKVNGVCKPQCTKACVNGYCSAPNVCSCKKGFVYNNSSAHVCVVPCDASCKGYCDDDKGCVPWNCSTPIPARGKRQQVQKTVCCPNYEYDSDQDKCLPVCYSPCINGTCVGVNQCACTPPLTLYNNTICIPSTCDNCEHGDCMAPNDCHCHKNYLNLNGACVPVCDNICVHGKCVEPNKCKCNDGYRPDPNDPYNCIPICDPACVNGTCVAHNKCFCSVGYEKTKDNWICKPTCVGCEYGDCISPNTCVCQSGYERIDLTCKPKCSSCSNGDCVAPEVCRCHEGYKLVDGHCSPICSPPCINGECVGPNNCSCNDGYDNRFGVCEPYCSKVCVNGHCSAPNFCTCNVGYVHDVTDYSFCIKPCIEPCKNGHCSPFSGECQCDFDFEYDNDTEGCIPMKPVPCEDCEGKCDNVTKECRCLNVRPCFFKSDDMEVPAEVVASDEVKMAGMNMTLMAIGGACLLLLILVVVVMQRLWYKRNDYTASKPTHENSGLGSVVYTVPNTLINQRASGGPMDEDSGDESETTDGLIRQNTRLS